MHSRSPTNLLTLGTVTLAASHPVMLIGPSHHYTRECAGFILLPEKDLWTRERVLIDIYISGVKSRGFGNRYFGSDVDEDTKG